MAKKRILEQDFLDLLANEEPISSARAKSNKKSKGAKRAFILSPVQKELLDFALSKSPKIVNRLVTAQRTQKLVARLERTYVGVQSWLHRNR